jgi:hypothetical protein
VRKGSAWPDTAASADSEDGPDTEQARSMPALRAVELYLEGGRA